MELSPFDKAKRIEEKFIEYLTKKDYYNNTMFMLACIKPEGHGKS